MDINRLCPGCMREMDGGMQKIKRQGICPYCGYDMRIDKQNARCLPINTILAGKYLVGAVLGEGGFGITYIGYDLNMQTRIAIKEYFPVELVSRDTTSMTGDRVVSIGGEKSATYKQGLKKYVAEAQNVSRFSEIPGVVSVKDFFYENETAYIVMEYIDGISLKDYLKERGGRLSEEESLAIMKPVLEALVKVHEAGIVHRDISPDNIMLTFRGGRDSGDIREYGNATGYGNERGHGDATGHRNATGHGAAGQRDVSAGDTDAARPVPSVPTAAGKESAAVRTAHGESGVSDMAAKGDGAASDIASVKLIDFGAARMTAKNDQKSLTIILKHGYAPEEQYRTHGEQGPWTDVYAVCAVLYRMLTGQTPVPAMDRMFQDGLKSFDDLNTKVSRNTQAAILKGLAVKKEDRIQSTQELMQALYEGRKLRTGRNARRTIIAAALGTVAVLGAAAVLGIILIGQRPGKEMSISGLTTGSLQDESRQMPANPEGQAAAEQQPGEPMDSSTAPAEGETAEILELQPEEEVFGEAIVEPNPQTSFAGASSHAVIRLDDGTVVSAGSNQYGQRNLAEWSRIAAVAAGDAFTAGLREDGKVVVAGELIGKEDVERWEGILAITGAGQYLYGLTAEGRLVVNMITPDNETSMTWTDIKAISAAPGTISALTSDGRVLTAASFELEPLEISGWEDVRYLACSQYFAYGLCEEGSVVAAPMWEAESPALKLEHEEWKDFRDIVQIYVNHAGIYGVDAEGRIHRSGWEYAGGNAEALEWSNLAGVTGTVSEDSRMMGLGKDGRILKAVENYGNADAEEMAGLKKVLVPWTDIEKSIAAIGITQEGKLLVEAYRNRRILDVASSVEDIHVIRWWKAEDTVTMTCAYLDTSGNLWMGEQDYEFQIADSSLKQIGVVYIDRGDFIVALKEDGTIGLYPAGICEIPDGLREAEDWSGVEQIVCYNTRFWEGVIIGLLEDGTVRAAGTSPDAIPSLDGLADIVSLHGGRYAAGGIRSDGTPIFLEDAPEYNYGQYNTYGWTDLTQLAMGLYHTAGLREDGTVCAVGRNDAGQCDVEGWTDIVYITATDCATLGIRSDGTLAIAGEVGW